MVDSNGSQRRWDLLLITARNDFQKSVFIDYLGSMKQMLRKYVRSWVVLADRAEDFGSGLATVFASQFVKTHVSNPYVPMGRVILIHAGGQSQRLPHVAPIGKAFELMPSGLTLLEEKLKSYVCLPEILENGMFVAFSNTYEKIDLIDSQKISAAKKAAVILFGHYSSTSIGSQHGVLSLDNKKPETSLERLNYVFQKPSFEKLIVSGSIVEKNQCITYSTFFLSQRVVYKLAEESKVDIPYREICCDYDFMCPLGMNCKEEYYSEDVIKAQWQKRFFDFFHFYCRQTAVVTDIRANFCRFNTTKELLSNISEGGLICHQDNKRFVRSSVDVELPSTTFAEYSVLLNEHDIPTNTLLSHVYIYSKLPIPMPSNSTIFTWKINCDRVFITFILSNDVDIKNPYNSDWFQHKIPMGSMYEAKIFPTGRSPDDSLLNTLRAIVNGIPENGVSIKEILPQIDMSFIWC